MLELTAFYEGLKALYKQNLALMNSIWPDENCHSKCRPKKCTVCGNLVQNPSFEAGLTGWTADNTVPSNENPFEGSQSANLGPGVASIFQDIPLSCNNMGPFLLSFNVSSGGNNAGTGNFFAELLWLDSRRKAIGTGLKAFIRNGNIPVNKRITYFDITEAAPAGAAWARLLFSKGEDTSPDELLLDQVVLTPVSSKNLLLNSSFEYGFTGWTSSGFLETFNRPLEGNGDAGAALETGTIFQDIAVTEDLVNSPLLLGFAASSSSESELEISVLWLDAANNVVGSGLDLSIPIATLMTQGSYLTWLGITDPVPAGAVTVRVMFTASAANVFDPYLFIDRIILSKAASVNLVQNPSFEDGLNNWNVTGAGIVITNDAYEGNADVSLFSTNGGAIFQDIPLEDAAGHCFLLNYAIGYRGVPNTPTFFPNVEARVLWLDSNGNEIGTGISMISPAFGSEFPMQWRVYAGITEAAPPEAAIARIYISKGFNFFGGMEVDKVLFARLV